MSTAAKNDDKGTEDYSNLLAEWKKYHEGKVTHPTKNEEISKPELMNIEISNIVDAEYNKIKDKISNDHRVTAEEIEPLVYELAKKSVLADLGVKEGGEEKFEGDFLKQRVQQFIIQMASQHEDDIETYEEAIEAIVRAPDPIYGENPSTGIDPSKHSSAILDSLINQYANLTHKSEHEATKGQSARRLRYLETELSNKKYRDQLHKEYGDIFKKMGREGHEFHPIAKARDILNIMKEAYTHDRISGNTLRRKYIKRPEGTMKETKPYSLK